MELVGNEFRTGLQVATQAALGAVASDAADVRLSWFDPVTGENVGLDDGVVHEVSIAGCCRP